MITVDRDDCIPGSGDDRIARFRHLTAPGVTGWFGDLCADEATPVDGTTRRQLDGRDIDTVAYVVDGTFLHIDPGGLGHEVPAGSVHLATAGSGNRHADPSAAARGPMRVIQVSIRSRKQDPRPQSAQAVVDWRAANNRWLPIVVPADAIVPAAPASAPLRIHQDVRMYVLNVQATAAVTHRFRPEAIGYVFALDGDVHLATDADAAELSHGGGARIGDEAAFSVRARTESARVLLVETMNDTA
jgi:redox-sensitive bicupin YhaK (pirin superfamily)